MSAPYLNKGSMMSITRWLSATALVCCLAACGGSDSKDYNTLREVAEDLTDTLCTKLDECDQIGTLTVQQCIDGALAMLCPTANDCTAAPPDAVSNDDIEDCLDEIDDLSCPVDLEGDLPAPCQDIVETDGGGGTLRSALRLVVAR